MIKKCLASVLTLTILFGLFANYRAFAGNDTKKVTPKEATQVALEYIKELSNYSKDWTFDELGSLIDLTDTSYDKIAYYVPIIREGKEIGYLIVASTKDRMPVLASRLTNEPLTITKGKIEAKISSEVGENKLIKPKQLVYINPFMIVAEYTILKNDTDIEKKHINLVNNTTIDEEEYKTLKHPEPQNPDKAKKSWERALSITSNSIITPSSSPYLVFKDISYFDNIEYDQMYASTPASACGPTAGAMICEYWRYRGYYNIHTKTNYYTDFANFFDHLYSDMGSNSAGPTNTQWISGMQQHINSEAGYNFSIYKATNSWTNYTNEIEAQRPACIRINFLSGHYYTWHYVVGRGYYIPSTTEQQEIYINDCWGGTGALDYAEYASGIYINFIRP